MSGGYRHEHFSTNSNQIPAMKNLAQRRSHQNSVQVSSEKKDVSPSSNNHRIINPHPIFPQIKVKLTGKKSKKCRKNSVVPYNRPFFEKSKSPVPWCIGTCNKSTCSERVCTDPPIQYKDTCSYQLQQATCSGHQQQNQPLAVFHNLQRPLAAFL